MCSTIGRQDIPRKANLYAWVKPQRPVPAARILEVDERLGPGGDRAARRSTRRACARGGRCRRRWRCRPWRSACCTPSPTRHTSARVAEILREELARRGGDGVDRRAAGDPRIRTLAGDGAQCRRHARRLHLCGAARGAPARRAGAGAAAADASRTAASPARQRSGKAPALTALSGPAAGVVGARAVAAAAASTTSSRSTSAAPAPTSA